MGNKQLSTVAVRMIGMPPLLSDEEMNTPQAAVRAAGKFLEVMDREFFCVINMQSDMKPVNLNVVSIGTLGNAMIHPREVYKSAILSNAACIMLIHNHPSGNLMPSREDIDVTERLQKAGAIIGIPVIDHIITGQNGHYFSFREQSMLPQPAD